MTVEDEFEFVPRVRPTPWQWLRYAVIGSVPHRNRSWVLYDVTCRTWVLRHASHYLVLAGPLVAAVLVLLPASIPVRIETAVAAGASLFIGYMCFTTESLERRAEKAGYSHGIAAILREERSIRDQHATAARFRARQDRRAHRR